jgi:alpha-tubulin suppressor-like RCC1 family protein
VVDRCCCYYCAHKVHISHQLSNCFMKKYQSNQRNIQLWSSGCNQCGQLSLYGSTENVNKFTLGQLPELAQTFSDVEQVKLVRTLGDNSVIVLNSTVVYGLGYFGAKNWLKNRFKVIFEDSVVERYLEEEYDSNLSVSLPVSHTFTSLHHRRTCRKVMKIACGFDHVIILDSEGDLWGFGGNENGELGQGHNKMMDKLVRINLPSNGRSAFNRPIIKLIACSTATYIVTTDEYGDSIWCCGDNKHQQLGFGEQKEGKMERVCQLTQMKSTWLQDKEIEDIACGSFHVAILTRDQIVFCFGRNKYGEIGIGSEFGNNIYISSPTPMLPVPEMYMDRDVKKKIISVHCTNVNTLLLLEDDTLLVCGCNDDGRLGFSESSKQGVLHPLKMPCKLSKIDCVSSGSFQYAILTKTGQLVLIGSNAYGQLGINSNNTPKGPVLINEKQLDTKTIFDVCCGNRHTLLLTKDKKSYPFVDVKQLVADMGKIGDYEYLFDVEIKFKNSEQARRMSKGIASIRCPRLLSHSNELEESIGLLLLHFVNTGKLSESYTVPEMIDTLAFLCCPQPDLNIVDEKYENNERMSNLEIMLVDSIKKSIGYENVVSIIMHISQNYSGIITGKYKNSLYNIWRHLLGFCKSVMNQNKFNMIQNYEEIPHAILVTIVGLTDIFTISDIAIPDPLEEHFGPIFNHKESSDVILLLDTNGSNRLYCHKLILSCRCKYFSIMFRSFAERESREVLFTPLEANGNQEQTEAATQFIKYLYTGSIEITADNAILLLLLANAISFDLESALIIKIQEVIIRHLDVTNVLNVFKYIINQGIPESFTPEASTGCDYDNDVNMEGMGKSCMLKMLESACITVCVQNWSTLVKKYGTEMSNFLTYEQYMQITSLSIGSDV